MLSAVSFVFVPGVELQAETLISVLWYLEGRAYHVGMRE